MADFNKGDRVLIKEGKFEGRWGTIIDKDFFGDELTVVLGDDDAREIRTHEAHVEVIPDN